MLIGVNDNPQQIPNTHELLTNTNSQVVRFPFWLVDGFDYKPFVNTLIAQGVTPLPVLDRKAMTWHRGWSLKKRFAKFKSEYPEILHWEIGNEPDSHGNSSSYQTDLDFSYWLYTARQAMPYDYLIAGGLVSGDANYLNRVDLTNVDAIALHPYGQSPARDGWGVGFVGDLIDSYLRFSKPIWITEFGGEESLFNNEHERAVYHSGMLQVLASYSQVLASIVFCYSDTMVPGFGLVTSTGEVKETCAAIHDAA